MKAPFLARMIAGLLWLSLLSPALAQGEVTGIVATNGQVRLTVATAPGRTLQVQQIETLGTRWWVDNAGAVAATGTQARIQFNAAAGQGFFRVLEFTNNVFWYDWTYRYQNPDLATWGLGAAQNSYFHQDRPYAWYIDQADTGAASGNNCGPSSATMGIKWYNGSFTGTAEEARNWSYSWRANGWWYTTDITTYLNLHSVPNTTSAYTGTNQLHGLLADGRLVILCIDTSYLTYNTTAAHRIDRFYSYGGGHFLVVKGARTVSGSLLFEVYDPNNWHAAYTDGTPKGRNRHLKAADLAASIQNWWSYLIVVTPPAGGGQPLRRESPWIVPVDPATIPAAWGI